MRDWREFAACFGTDLNLWFPERGSPPGTRAKAVAICNECPVKQDCLDDALRSETKDHSYGIRGGMMPTARSRLARA